MSDANKGEIEARIRAATAEIERVLAEQSCALVAVPTYKPDGRGGWFLTTHVQVVPK